MKIWHGYGSEHSMNLVMIGYFKSAEDAKNTLEFIEQLTKELSDKVEIGAARSRFDKEVMDILLKLNCWNLAPTELEHFLYEIHTEVDGDKIILTTDEFEVSAFFKLMVENGARVEMYSAHHYPGTEYGRGK